MNCRSQRLVANAPSRSWPPTTTASSCDPIASTARHRRSVLVADFLDLTAGFGYNWSTDSLHWQDLVKRPTRAIVCKSQKEAAFRFQAYALHDKSDPLVR